MTILPAVMVLGLIAASAPSSMDASDLPGRVLFAGAGVPGATITATRLLDSAPTRTILSAEDGTFRLANLEDGTWRVRIEMRGFVTVERDVALPFTEPVLSIALTMRSYEDIVGSAGSPKPIGPPESPVNAASDPDIVNGSVTNGAATPVAQSRAMGNNRPRGERVYRGAFTTALANSAWNARPYSFGGSAVSADTGDVQLAFTLRGPFRIPWLIRDGPNMTLSVQRGVTSTATAQSAIMPTEAERIGDFSHSTAVIHDPTTGLPFSGNMIPRDRIAPQAAALLAYYPLPNTPAASGANFQRPIVTTAREDAVRFQMALAPSRRDRIGWDISGRRTITDAVNIFGFTNTRRQAAADAGVTWTHSVSTRLQLRARYQFTRTAATLTPFFANRANVSGDAGIAGNEQRAVNWGPPALLFPTIADLRDSDYERSSTITHAVSASTNWRPGRHNISAGGDIRPVAFDVSSQPDPRGTLSFTGAATGDALADFLLGLPTTSAIAFSDARTELRGASYAAFVMDDFRVAPGITVNAGVRWEYEVPFTEASGRLVNFDVAPDFTAVSPVLATSPVGPLTGRTYPASLLRPDRTGILPRVGVSWRPILGSTLVIRAGYGLYRNLGGYQSLVQLLAQQPPFSRTFSVQNSAATPLTLANPFPVSLPSNSNTFAIDPDFRVGFVHSWQATAQREFPASMTIIAGYFGDKGTHLMQAFLPNTYPAFAVPASAGQAGPSGFVYVTSNGTSNRHAVQLSARRRLRNGFGAGVQYTLAKATDNAATFNSRSITPASLVIAQDWLNPNAERGPSSFDQRHVVAMQVQYSTAAGLTGGSLAESVTGSLFRGWTIELEMNAGSGLPFTPVTFEAIPGTGFVGVRPRLTGVSPEPAAPGSYANAEAFAAPFPGSWGDAGRNSIRGPAPFSMNMAISRSFQLPRQLRLDWRVNVTNVLNRVTFSTINTTVASPQFGMPTRANPMRRIHTSLLFGF
ncbi:MAG: carboxypeptidase-like regulatory domain-containing protein [Vicinamibacterales bacterium]